MAKTIIAQSGDIVNYDNIIAIYTDAEKRLQNDDSITVEYYVKADSANCTYTLGIRYLSYRRRCFSLGCCKPP